MSDVSDLVDLDQSKGVVWIVLDAKVSGPEAENLGDVLVDCGYDPLFSRANGPELILDGAFDSITLPKARRANIEKFLVEHDIRAVIWSGPQGLAKMAPAIEAQKVPLFYINARSDEAHQLRRNWLARWRSKTGVKFDRIFAVDQEAADMFQASGYGPERIEHLGPLKARNKARIQDCSDELRRSLAEGLSSRPLWFANHIYKSELKYVLAAQRQAARQHQRLIVVIKPARSEDVDAFEKEICNNDLACRRSSKLHQIESNDVVILVDQKDQSALWYRLAPLTFLGGTIAKVPNPDPMVPALIGSAILYGPLYTSYGQGFRKLAAKRAALRVHSGQGLAQELPRMLSADQTAQLCLNAWDVATEPLALTNRIADRLDAELKQRSQQ